MTTNVVLCVCGTVCLGTDFGINHGHLEQPWQRYEMYRKMYTNCTYVDGNLEILFLDGEHHYDMTFLKVCIYYEQSFIVVTL